MYSAYITTIHELRKHNNADRLQCATIFGNNVIVSMDFHDGDRVVYFPVDGQLSEEFAVENNLIRVKGPNGENIGGYLDPDKRNIRALKLRGEQSDGLVLPIQVLAKYTDISELNDGDAINVLNGHTICEKYIPRTNPIVSQRASAPSISKTRKSKRRDVVKYPYFRQHVDTEQLAYNQSAFHPGDICTITLKMHGTSARTANTICVGQKSPSKIGKLLGKKAQEIRTYKIISGTRRVVLNNFDEGGWYGANAFREKYHNLFKERLPKGMCAFYEIVGYVDETTPIMSRCNNSLVKDKEFSRQYGKETVFSYGCEPGENECYVYRMTMTNEDGFMVELPWWQVQIECEKMGVKCVPTFERFIYTTWEDLMQRVEKYYEGPDPIGMTHIREGVVVRIENRPSFTAYKHKGFLFKTLEGIIKDTADAPDMEEAEELLVEDIAHG